MKPTFLRLLTIALALAVLRPVTAEAQGFEVTVLGAEGGLRDGDLSAYLVQQQGASSGVLLDAGTVLNGLEKADRAHAFDGLSLRDEPGISRTGRLLHQVIRGYLISHAHLDHIAGLVAVSPDDPGKPVYALPSVLSVLQDDVFNHRVWPNLGDNGVSPAFGLLHYHALTTGVAVALGDTGLTATAYPLSHAGVESTAFLIRAGSSALLYLGDTGPDAIEKTDKLDTLWKAVVPLVRSGALRGMIVECSYDNRRADRQLFGHLTPHWLLAELDALQAQAGISMRGFPVLVTHIKPVLETGIPVRERIASELEAGNRNGFRFHLAEQGMSLAF